MPTPRSTPLQPLRPTCRVPEMLQMSSVYGDRVLRAPLARATSALCAATCSAKIEGTSAALNMAVSTGKSPAIMASWSCLRGNGAYMVRQRASVLVLDHKTGCSTLGSRLPLTQEGFRELPDSHSQSHHSSTQRNSFLDPPLALLTCCWTHRRRARGPGESPRNPQSPVLAAAPCQRPDTKRASDREKSLYKF